MLDGLQPALRFAIMSILCTVYESGIVDEVDISDVMRLFGVQPQEGFDTRFSFNDEGWVEAYLDFRENAGEELLAYAMDELDIEDPEGPDTADPDLDPNRKLH